MAALAAELDGFEFVEGLDVLAVEVSLVAHDLCEGVAVGDETAADLLVEDLRSHPLGHGNTEGAFGIAGGARHVVRDILEGDLNHGGLIADGALKAPEEGGDAFG
jgi:hypothetical protein